MDVKNVLMITPFGTVISKRGAVQNALSAATKAVQNASKSAMPGDESTP